MNPATGRDLMKGEAFVFINTWQAARFGHVGWGFALDEQRQQYYFGSTDHLYRHPWWDLPGWLRYAHVPGDKDVDWWGAVGTREEMLHRMCERNDRDSGERYHIRYQLAKAVEVDNANPGSARQLAESLATGGWSVVANNCVHQTHRVLQQYGAELPAPAQPLINLVPKVWFSKLPGELLEL